MEKVRFVLFRSLVSSSSCLLDSRLLVSIAHFVSFLASFAFVEYIAPSSALPIGASRTISETQLVKVDPSLPAHESRLLNALLALVRVPASALSSTISTGEDKKPVVGGDVKMEEVGAAVEGEVVEGEMGEELAKSEIAGFVVM